MSLRERAEIRRATLAARRALEELDAAGAEELARLYGAAAERLRAAIARAAAGDGNLSLVEMRQVLAQVETILAQVTELRNATVSAGLSHAAALGAGAVLGTAAAMPVATEAVSFVRHFVAADGLMLSDRLWRIDRAAKAAIAEAIELAVIQGHGSAEAAREFLARGREVPPEVAARLGAANAARLGDQAAELMTGRGESALYQAHRVFRTEINRAHGEAYMAGAEDHPDFAGFRFLLSPAHPKHDICDLLAAQNLHGLGPGVYPSREKCPWPAHPNTLSYVEVVYRDEITDADRAGKETPMAALERLPAAVRAGVLGKGKAELFNEGRLRQGMIRAPLSKVAARIARTESSVAGQPPDTYAIAHAGGAHHGFLLRQRELPDHLIEKGMRSLQGQIDRHERWIAHPEEKVGKDWPPERVADLVEKKWPKDIARQQAQLEILGGIMKERKDGTG
ncbi:MAG: hypothetical protein H3C26_00025 [Rhodocyclaceae bacterium]|nr:hypothetical protein [Rhodocyclaceae bacterium]